MESRHKRNLVAGQDALAAGLPVPLFDRFDEEMDNSRMIDPYRIQTLPLLLQSIQKEIENLLNTRLSSHRFAGSSFEPRSQPQTVLDYGLPDFAHLSAGSPLDAVTLASVVSGKIAAFEPRLQNPILELHGAPDNPARMIGMLSGTIRLEQVSHPVSFPVDLGESAGVLIGPGEMVN